MFLKREQVQITYYTWLLLAALYVLSRSETASQGNKLILAAGVVLVGALSISVVVIFQLSMNRFRKRLNAVHQTYFTERDRKALHLDAQSQHLLVTVLLIAVCVVASIFTFSVIVANAIPNCSLAELGTCYGGGIKGLSQLFYAPKS